MGLPSRRLFHTVGLRVAAPVLKYTAGRDASETKTLEGFSPSVLLFYDGLSFHRMLQLPCSCQRRMNEKFMFVATLVMSQLPLAPQCTCATLLLVRNSFCRLSGRLQLLQPRVPLLASWKEGIVGNRQGRLSVFPNVQYVLHLPGTCERAHV